VSVDWSIGMNNFDDMIPSMYAPLINPLTYPYFSLLTLSFINPPYDPRLICIPNYIRKCVTCDININEKIHHIEYVDLSVKYDIKIKHAEESGTDKIINILLFPK
jgi:hypothetical protein